MGENDNAGAVLAEGADVGGREPLVDFAVTLPGNDLHSRLLGDILRQVFVRDHDHSVDAPFAGDVFHHSRRV